MLGSNLLASRRRPQLGHAVQGQVRLTFRDVRGATPRGLGWITFFLVIGAVIFRVAYYFQYRATSVFFATPLLDASIYDTWARTIAAGAWAPPPEPFYFAPGYAYALGVLYRLAGPSPPAVYIAQLALGVLNILLIGRLAAKAFGAPAGAWAALLAALYASFPFLEAKIMSATLALTLLLVSLVCLSQAASRGAAWRWALGGAALGATSLVRPETLLAASPLLFWTWRFANLPRAGTGRRAAFASVTAVVMGWGLMIMPAVRHNLETGGGAAISSQGGLAFYQANNPHGRGLYVPLTSEGFSGVPERQAAEEKAIAEQVEGRALTRSEVSSFWLRKGLAFIREHPVSFLWLLGMKLFRFVGSYEYSTEYVLYVERKDAWLLWLPWVPFGLLLALAVPSLARGVRPGDGNGGRLNPTGWLLLAVLAANLTTILVFYVSSRYRLPSVAPLMAFAGATLAALGNAVRAGRRKEALRTALLVAALFIFAHVEKDASSVAQEANTHYNGGSLWQAKGQHERALVEFRRAIEMDGSRYPFWINMAASLHALGRPAEAAVAYGAAGQIWPGSYVAHAWQGRMLELAGDWRGARIAYARAERLNPNDFALQLALGRVASRLGDESAARRHLDRALVLNPTSKEARTERDGL